MQPRNRNEAPKSPINVIGGAVIFIVILVGLFLAMKLVLRILAFLTPIFLIATLIIDYKVIVNYGKMLIRLFNRNPVFGVIAMVLSVLGISVVAPLLLGKALLNKKVKQAKQDFENRRHGESVKYEEVNETDKDDQVLDLHDDRRPNPLDKSKKYDELFEDLDYEEDDKRPNKLW